MSKLPSWRKPNPHKPVGGPNSDPNDLKRVPATRFFDNLSFIGNESVGCFLIGTISSYFLETPTGASIVAANLLAFAVFSLAGKRQ